MTKKFAARTSLTCDGGRRRGEGRDDDGGPEGTEEGEDEDGREETSGDSIKDNGFGSCCDLLLPKRVPAKGKVSPGVAPSSLSLSLILVTASWPTPMLIDLWNSQEQPNEGW